jgi:hypothetical protein
MEELQLQHVPRRRRNKSKFKKKLRKVWYWCEGRLVCYETGKPN